MRMLVRTHFLRSRTRKQGGREGKTCAALLHGDQAPGDHLGGADFFDVIEFNCVNTGCVIPSRILSTTFLFNGKLMAETPCVCRPHSGRV